MTTTTAPPAAAEQLHTAVTGHSPTAGPPGWPGPCCHDCSYTAGQWTVWPCTPLLDAADVTDVPNGWSITPR